MAGRVYTSGYVAGSGCSNAGREQRRLKALAPAHNAASSLPIWAGWLVGHRDLRRLLAAHLREDSLVFRHRRAAGRRPGQPAWCRPRWPIWTSCGSPLWDTINIATLGTVLGLHPGGPDSLPVRARNTTPSRAFVRPVALFIIVSSRSINSLIWALMLVTIIGPGVFAGIIAIGLRSIGFCGQAALRGDRGDRRNPGRGDHRDRRLRPQKLAYGIVPQVLPAFAGISVFRWDINIRESTVLGLVGAGGIGLQLNASIQNLAWSQVCMVLLVIIATVIVSEWVSAKVRHAII